MPRENTRQDYYFVYLIHNRNSEAPNGRIVASTAMSSQFPSPSTTFRSCVRLYVALAAWSATVPLMEPDATVQINPVPITAVPIPKVAPPTTPATAPATAAFLTSTGSILVVRGSPLRILLIIWGATEVIAPTNPPTISHTIALRIPKCPLGSI